MAALLHVFSSTPPVVRRRAKELLEVIREALRKGLIGPAAPSDTPVVPAEVAPEPKEDVVVSSEPAPASPSLWSGSKHLPMSTTSSPFGATTVLPHPLVAYSTCHSSLFGVPPSTEPKTKSHGRFQDVINRIHSTLVIAPTVPKYECIVHSYYVMSFLSQVPAQETAVTTTEVVTTLTPEIPISIDGATPEIPFVPASQRQTTNPDIVDYTIAVVDQRQKKRKRAKKAGTTADNDGDGKMEATAEAEEVVPFDFQSAPNILDDGVEEHEDRKAGKGKLQKRGVLDRGDFPAVPEDQREVKSGNISRTFRS
ncbi:hypothetical protein EI94DRAFT_1814578 [Lactarius quietus]|nr:hypothetical protein EI94DRAFT_1814578 [Lactarius quietus]